MALRSRLALTRAGNERAEAVIRSWWPALPRNARPVLPAVPSAPPAAPDHPAIEAAEAELEASDLAREATRRFVASPEVSVGWQREELELGSVDGPVFRVAWSVPLFDRRRAEAAEAEARRSGARARLALVRQELEAARPAARTSFDQLNGALGDATEATAASERMLDGVEAAFRLGEAGLTDLLETHRSVTEGKLAVLELREAALAAHRELERLAPPTYPASPLAADTPQEESHP